ncbi:hypothetical protein CsSME_00033560 [Camellia sinensis var. sinensis]
MSEPVPNPPIPPQNQIYEAIRIFDPFPTHSIQGRRWGHLCQNSGSCCFLQRSIRLLLLDWTMPVRRQPCTNYA